MTEFERLLISMQPELRAVARKMTGNADVAGDLMQQANLKAWTAREQFKPSSNFRAWILTIMRHQWLSDIRLYRSRKTDVGLGDFNALVSGGQEESLLLSQTLEKMQFLPRRHQEALIHGARGDSFSESAVGIPVGTAKSRRSRARKYLTEMLG